MPNYPHAAGRKNWDKHGESPSLLDFAGVVGDGVHDDATGIQHAINDTLASGGSRALRIPGGYTFLCGSPLSLPSGVLNLTIFGDGDGSIIKRGAAMPNGSGLFDIAGTGVTLRNFVIDGDVTTAAGLNYSAFSDPMDNLLTKNSSVWAHGGTADLLLDGVRIYHTGGYAVLLDATAGDIADVTVTGCRLRNNRPHLFGTSSLDLNYGSWTGGIHYQGNGTSHCVRNLSVTGCKFQRSTGNQVWGHAYAFTQMHENVRVTNNDFIDIGRDGVELGNTTGGVVAGNVGRRIGYIAVDDTSAALPKYLAGQYAVFIDTSGTAGCDYTNNTCVSALGAFFDLDGFSYGRVSGNTCRVPSASDPEYTEDLISSWPGNYTYGVQTGNNYYAPGGTNVSICDNTFVNCGEGAIRLFAARGCHVAGNTINHPAGAAFAPIILGNFVPAMGGGQIDTVDCDIADNNIQWSPATALAAVQELENWGAGSMPWSGEVNWVADNKVFGTNAFEFAKAASSNSVAGFLISNAATPVSAAGYASTYADTAAVHLAVNGGAFKPVARVGGSAGHVQFNDSTGVNLDGSANLAWDNTGKVLTVGGGAGTGHNAYAFNSNAVGANIGFQLANLNFLVDGNGNVTSGAAVVANDFVLKNGSAPATGAGFAYIYADAAAIHIAVNGGAFAAIATVAGSTSQIQFNGSGALAASSNLTWNNTGQVLTIAGGAATGVAAYAFNSQATGANIGFQLANLKFLVDGNGNVTSSAAVVANSFVLKNASAPSTSSGFGYLYADASAIHVSVNGGAFAAIATVAGASGQIQFNSGGLGASSNLTWTGAQLAVTGIGTGFAGIALTSGYVSADGGFATSSSSSAAVNAPNGTIQGKFLTATSTMYLADPGSTPSASTSGNVAFHSRAASGLLISLNGGAWANIVNNSNAWVSSGGVVCPHAASVAGGNFFVTKNSDTAYIQGIDDHFLDQGGTARYFVGGIYIGTSSISR